MDHPDLVLYILKNSLEALVIAGFATLIALLAIIFALPQTEKKTFAGISLFTLASAPMLVSESQASLLIVDIDHFKRFNDIHGHEAGDNALKIVAGILQNQFRESDIVCRYGGEEFVVVMPGATSEAARDKANQLCEAVAASDPGRQGALSRQVSRS